MGTGPGTRKCPKQRGCPWNALPLAIRTSRQPNSHQCMQVKAPSQLNVSRDKNVRFSVHSRGAHDPKLRCDRTTLPHRKSTPAALPLAALGECEQNDQPRHTWARAEEPAWMTCVHRSVASSVAPHGPIRRAQTQSQQQNQFGRTQRWRAAAAAHSNAHSTRILLAAITFQYGRICCVY